MLQSAMHTSTQSPALDYNDDSSVLSSALRLDNGYEDNASVLRVPEFAQMDGASPTESPTFAVDLSDLFPFLKVNQLPLYMIEEPINIELTFYPTVGERVQIGDNASTSKESLIRRTDLKFCADYVYYGAGDEMARYAAANKDMSFSFVDYRAIESTITNTAVKNGIIRNIGMANRVCPRLISMMSTGSKLETQLLSDRNALSTASPGEVAAQDLKYNIRYNDRFEFTTDVNNTARMFSILTDSEGVPFLNRGLYSAERGYMANTKVEGEAGMNELTGHFFYMGTKLTGGRVGQRGIEFHLAGTFPAEVAGYTLRNYVEYLRVMRLTDGMTSVFNA